MIGTPRARVERRARPRLRAMLEPGRRKPLYERVVQRLEALIRAEELKPGDRLIAERELAGRLGVSRTSVRQALTALRVRGVVEVRHGDGIYLLRHADDLLGSLAEGLIESHAHLPAINEAREAIEPYAARLAARRRTDEDLGALRGALGAMRDEVAAGEPGTGGDERFHSAVMAAAHNEVLTTLYEQLAAGLGTTSQASLAREGQPARSLGDHEAVLRAIEARDEERAEMTMRLHVRAFSDLELAPRDDAGRA
jgi:GntR family transcriptional regulator, transcriptional repressor for pyruvate dehydrogenase complex